MLPRAGSTTPAQLDLPEVHQRAVTSALRRSSSIHSHSSLYTQSTAFRRRSTFNLASPPNRFRQSPLAAAAEPQTAPTPSAPQSSRAYVGVAILFLLGVACLATCGMVAANLARGVDDDMSAHEARRRVEHAAREFSAVAFSNARATLSRLDRVFAASVATSANPDVDAFALLRDSIPSQSDFAFSIASVGGVQYHCMPALSAPTARAACYIGRFNHTTNSTQWQGAAYSQETLLQNVAPPMDMTVTPDAAITPAVSLAAASEMLQGAAQGTPEASIAYVGSESIAEVKDALGKVLQFLVVQQGLRSFDRLSSSLGRFEWNASTGVFGVATVGVEFSTLTASMQQVIQTHLPRNAMTTLGQEPVLMALVRPRDGVLLAASSDLLDVAPRSPDFADCPRPSASVFPSLSIRSTCLGNMTEVQTLPFFSDAVTSDLLRRLETQPADEAVYTTLRHPSDALVFAVRLSTIFTPEETRIAGLVLLVKVPMEVAGDLRRAATSIAVVTALDLAIFGIGVFVCLAASVMMVVIVVTSEGRGESSTAVFRLPLSAEANRSPVVRLDDHHENEQMRTPNSYSGGLDIHGHIAGTPLDRSPHSPIDMEMDASMRVRVSTGSLFSPAIHMLMHARTHWALPLREDPVALLTRLQQQWIYRSHIAIVTIELREFESEAIDKRCQSAQDVLCIAQRGTSGKGFVISGSADTVQVAFCDFFPLHDDLGSVADGVVCPGPVVHAVRFAHDLWHEFLEDGRSLLISVAVDDGYLGFAHGGEEVDGTSPQILSRAPRRSRALIHLVRLGMPVKRPPLCCPEVFNLCRSFTFFAREFAALGTLPDCLSVVYEVVCEAEPSSGSSVEGDRDTVLMDVDDSGGRHVPARDLHTLAHLVNFVYGAAARRSQVGAADNKPSEARYAIWQARQLWGEMQSTRRLFAVGEEGLACGGLYRQILWNRAKRAIERLEATFDQSSGALARVQPSSATADAFASFVTGPFRPPPVRGSPMSPSHGTTAITRDANFGGDQESVFRSSLTTE